MGYHVLFISHRLQIAAQRRKKTDRFKAILIDFIPFKL